MTLLLDTHTFLWFWWADRHSPAIFDSRLRDRYIKHFKRPLVIGLDHAQRACKKVPKAAKASDSRERLRKALAKRTKGDLVGVLLEFAGDDPKTFRRLAARFELETPPKELVVATRQAIASATDFDEREINYNFDYDSDAYEEVKRNFGRLITLGQLRVAMELALTLMKEGSYQVEMSDEGMMTDDIEECLRVVIVALKKCDLPASDVLAWCEKMTKSDRVGFLCDKELRALRD